jgi:hypothetical protein
VLTTTNSGGIDMANPILDHSVYLRQSLAELTFRAGIFCQLAEELKAQVTKQISQLDNYAHRIQIFTGKGIVPLCDVEHLKNFAQKKRIQLNIAFDSFLKEKQHFESKLRHFESILHQAGNYL